MAQSNKKKTNRGGAPRKDDADKIAPVISVYFSKKEYKILEDYMKENNLVIKKKSGLLKKITLDSITKKNIILTKQNDPKLIFEVNKIGININQLAKKLNSLDALSPNELSKMHNLVKQLSNFITKA